MKTINVKQINGWSTTELILVNKTEFDKYIGIDDNVYLRGISKTYKHDILHLSTIYKYNNLKEENDRLLSFDEDLSQTYSILTLNKNKLDCDLNVPNCKIIERLNNLKLYEFKNGRWSHIENYPLLKRKLKIKDNELYYGFKLIGKLNHEKRQTCAQVI